MNRDEVLIKCSKILGSGHPLTCRFASTPPPIPCLLCSFPSSSGFSFSAWIRIPSSTLLTTVPVFLPLLTLTPSANDSSSSGSAEFFSLTYSPPAKSFFLTTSLLSTPTPILNDGAPTPLTPDKWHHVSFTYLPPKRLLSKKASLTLYLDAIPLLPSLTLPQLSFSALELTQVHMGKLPSAPSNLRETTLTSSPPPRAMLVSVERVPSFWFSFFFLFFCLRWILLDSTCPH